MKSVTGLLVIVAILNIQVAAANENVNQIIKNEERDLRNIKDIWNSIKNSAQNAWNAIKNVAQNTKEKIKSWLNTAKKRACDIIDDFKVKIKKLKEKTKEVIKEILGTGKLVKQCLEKDNDTIEKILETIIKSTTVCITENMSKVSQLDDHQYKLQLNDSKFLDEVENKLNFCINSDHVEECMESVRKEIYEEIDATENDVLKTSLDTRGVVDDLLDAMIACSVDGLLEASASITLEALRVVQCVLKNQDSDPNNQFDEI